MIVRLALLSLCAAALFAADQDYNGRWDITVPHETRSRAWWLEVTGAGTPAIAGKFVGSPGGQMDVIPKISVENGELVFVFEKTYRGKAGVPREQQPKQRGVYRAKLEGGKLNGAFAVEGVSGTELKWFGVRAPQIADKDDGSWRDGTAVGLFNGKDMTGWRPMVAGQKLGWMVKDGFLTNEKGANNLVSEGKFWNFKLHVEYRVPKGSNSGIGLRGRYEVQIMEDYGRAVDGHSTAAIYSRILPAVNASKPAGEWQTFDIRLVGRIVTVVHNGKTVIDKKEIEGLTAMASDPHEAEPGPITLQGDHGPVEFRKITLTPLTKK